jgi:hypothetical protein
MPLFLIFSLNSLRGMDLQSFAFTRNLPYQHSRLQQADLVLYSGNFLQRPAKHLIRENYHLRKPHVDVEMHGWPRRKLQCFPAKPRVNNDKVLKLVLNSDASFPSTPTSFTLSETMCRQSVSMVQATELAVKR